MTKQYVELDRNNRNNYMFDTSAYNHIIQSKEKMEAAKRSILYGFCYYSTPLQDNELAGKGAKTYNSDCVSITDYVVPPEFKQKIYILDKELNVQLVPEIAISMRNHTRLDGTNRFVASDSLSGQIYEKIVSKKAHDKTPFEFVYDAMIAEAAINYGCILVSDDGALRDEVNLLCPSGAITTDELLEIINTYK